MDDLLRNTFARQEELVPVAPPELGESIVAGARRVRALRRWAWTGLTGLCAAAALLSVPFVAGSHTPDPPADAVPGSPVNLLIVGIDRGGGEPARVNADAIVLLHVNPGARSAYEVIIPRDLMLDLPGLGRQRADGAYLVGGYQLAAGAVAGLTGLSVDGGAVVDLAGLESVTRAAGGVDLCVERRTESRHLGADGLVWDGRSTGGREPMVYEAGCRHFAAPEAVDYLRQTVGSGDDRALHQYLTGLARAATDPIRLPALLAAAGDALELHLGAGSLTALAARMTGVDPGSVAAIRLPTAGAEHGPEPLPGGDGLYAAMRDGRVGAWLSAHPQYRS